MSTLHALTRANISILKQKSSLIDLLAKKFGNKKKTMYSRICPIVNASVGQHIRHSLDHIELAARVAAEHPNIYNNELHYDLRRRGGNDESDIEVAMERISTLLNVLEDTPCEQSNRKVVSFLMLSGDPIEFQLSSTVERELAFACHHGIHHMAMIKIILVESLGISIDELSDDFGKAPSTIVHDKTLF
jgi:hypothetical protein